MLKNGKFKFENNLKAVDYCFQLLPKRRIIYFLKKEKRKYSLDYFIFQKEKKVKVKINRILESGNI